MSSGLFFSIGTSFSQGVGGDWMFQGGGLSFEGYAAKTLSHGMAGGVLETLQGGRFGHGFLSAGVSEALSPVIGRAQNPLAEGVIRSVVGGTASVAGGGKFANGAVTAAFGFAFNHLGHSSVGAVLTKTVEITDLELNPYVGPLSNSQNDDVNSINSSIAMLGKMVEASGNSDYIEKFNNTSFNYVPGYEDQTSLRTAEFAGINPRTGGYLIRFTAGFHKYERPGDYIAKSYNFQFLKSGPTLGLFLAAHEFGHVTGIWGNESGAHNFAGKFIQQYPQGIDADALHCYKECIK